MRKENTLGLDKKKVTIVRRSLTVLGFSILVLILSLRKLRGFLHLWFPQGKTLCSIVLLVILLVKYPNNAILILKNQHGIRADLRRRHCAAIGTRVS